MPAEVSVYSCTECVPPSIDATVTLRNDPMTDCRRISVGVTGDRNVTFIATLPATFITKVDLVDVYSKFV